MEGPLFAAGAVKDSFDSRDIQWREVAFGIAPFDWNTGYDIETVLSSTLGTQFTLPTEDQNGSGSCGGQAWRYQGEVLDALLNKRFERKSAKFIYAQTFVAGGGSAGRDNANIYIKQGIASEAALPSYDNGQPPSEAFMERTQDITDEVRLNARHAMSMAYANVSTNINELAQAIQANNGTIIGITGQNNGTWSGNQPLPPTSGGTHWYHWLYAGKAKMLNGKKAIGVKNSWGDSVGDHGWQWLTEDYFTAQLSGDPFGSSPVWSGWTHIVNPNPIIKGYAHLFTKEMGIGALTTGPEIVCLQKALQVEQCFPAGVPTFPNFGPTTLASVKKFQAKYGITQTGYVGPKTLAKLNDMFA